MTLSQQRTLRWQAWLPMLALVLQALAPLLAQAAPAQAAHVIEICTAEGIKTVRGDPAAPSGQAATHQHCVLCTPAQAPLLPQASVPNVPMCEAAQAVPVQAAAPVPRTVFSSSAPPTGPPARS